MKTTDLIPILLYHLKNGDKYGLELVDACKECSNGRIEIKQPTLYSVLKKLEKSRFISSYWEDSDIGGKRHYYKITDNGLAQLDTYPPLDELVHIALSDENEVLARKDNLSKERESASSTTSPFDNYTFNNHISNDNTNSPFNNFLLNNDKQHLETSMEDNIEEKAYSDENFTESKDFISDIKEIATKAEEIVTNEGSPIIEENNGSNLSDTSTISYDENNFSVKEQVIEQSLVNIDNTSVKNENEFAKNYIVNNSADKDKIEVEKNINSDTLAGNLSVNGANFEGNTTNNMSEKIENSKDLPSNFSSLITENQENSSRNLTVEHYSNVDHSDLELIKKEAENNSSTNKSFDIFDALNYEDGSNDVQENEKDFNIKSTVNLTPPTNSPTTLELNNPFFKDEDKKTLSEKTNFEINSENIKLLSKDDVANEFAEDKKVSTFAKKKKIEPANNDVYKSSLEEVFNSKNINIEPQQTTKCDIAFNDYVDYKNDAKVKSAKRSSKLRLIKTLFSSFISLCIILATFCITLKQEFTTIYGVFSGIFTLLVVFYACNFVGKYKIDYLHFINNEFNFNFKKQIIIRCILFAVLTILLIVINLVLSIKNIFAISNFGNLLAPICILTILFTDYFCALFFYKLIK